MKSTNGSYPTAPSFSKAIERPDATAHAMPACYRRNSTRYAVRNQNGQSDHPTHTPIRLSLPILLSPRSCIESQLPSHADALLLDLQPNLIAWFKLHSNSRNTCRSNPATVPSPSSTHFTASLPVRLRRRRDSLKPNKCFILKSQCFELVWIDVSKEITNTLSIHIFKIECNISNGSFQILELKVTSLATILNTRKLRNGILAVELTSLSEEKKRDSMI
jgi:hypothetical protein